MATSWRSCILLVAVPVLMQAPKTGFFYVLDRTDGELISAEAYVPITWAEGVDPETGRPIENPEAHYIDEPKLTLPGPYGGHNWHRVGGAVPESPDNINTHQAVITPDSVGWVCIGQDLYVGWDRASNWQHFWKAPRAIRMLATRPG